jgi:SAM-dependent methyltransferase
MITDYALSLLVCPVCKSGVVQSGEKLVCSNAACKNEYDIKSGVLIMWPDPPLKNKLLTPRWHEAQVAEEKGAVSFSQENRRIGKEFNLRVRSLFMAKCTGESNILEVGCGGYGIVSGLTQAKCKIGIDPLMVAYVENYAVDDSSLYISGVGECLPVKDGSLDICFCNNVLDHCSRPADIVNEIHSKIRRGGTLIVGMYCFVRPWEKSLYTTADKLHLWRDVFHPHLYIEKEFVKMVTSAGFEIKERYDLSRDGYVLGESLVGELTEKARKNQKLFSIGAAIYHGLIKRIPVIKTIFQADQKYIILECIRKQV